MTTEDNQLAVIAQQNGLATESASTLIQAFEPLFAKADALVREAGAINVTDATQVSEIKKARAMRLKLREVRITAENARKSLKEESLRRGKAIDGVANFIKFMIEPVEEALLEQEEIAERMEAYRKSELKAGREEALAKFGVDCRLYNLGDMPEETYQSLLATSKAEHEQRAETARKAEAQRIEEQAERARQERLVRDENARLRKEAEQREAAARAEREKLEAAAQEERKARVKAEAELRARGAEEIAKAAAVERAKKKAARAPDKEKIQAICSQLKITLPDVATPEAREILIEISSRIGSLLNFISIAAEAL